jgi:hypothetical protein
MMLCYRQIGRIALGDGVRKRNPLCTERALVAARTLCYRFFHMSDEDRNTKALAIPARFVGPDDQEIPLGNYVAIPRSQFECLQKVAAAAKKAHAGYYESQKSGAQANQQADRMLQDFKALGHTINALDAQMLRLAAVNE